MGLSRERRATAEGSPARVPLDDEHTKRWPTLVAYLRDALWDDGKARETSTLLLLFEEGVWKACLHDRDGSRSLWRVSDRLGEVLDSLERALVAGADDWRRKAKHGPRR